MIAHPTIQDPMDVMESRDQGAVDIESSYEIITNKHRKCNILKEMLQDRSLLTVLFEGGKKAFTTAVIDIDASGEVLILDELVPNEGNKLLVPGVKVWLLGQIRGVRTGFQAQLKESGQEFGIYYHRMLIPDAIRYQQRRSSFRVPVSYGLRNMVQFSLYHGKPPFIGRIRDLSIGGMLIQLAEKIMTEDLPEGTLVPNCQIDLPGEGVMTTDAEIRHVYDDGTGQTDTVGMAFHEVSPHTERRIQRSVNYLEREQLKNKK